MPILIDSHVHFYPCYDAATFFGAFRSAVRRAGAPCGAMMLCEREGADAFGEWAAGRGLPSGWRLARAEECALLLSGPGGDADIVVAAGRQTACAERLEIVSLGTRRAPPDGVRAADAVLAATKAGALPALAWGVGKWLFSRAKVVEGLLRRFPGPELAIGDTSMRPSFWPEPATMRRAPAHGRRVLRGSDPLPPALEAVRPGQWADLADAPFDPSQPLLPQLLAILREAPLRAVGHRAGPMQFLRRMA